MREAPPGAARVCQRRAGGRVEVRETSAQRGGPDGDLVRISHRTRLARSDRPGRGAGLRPRLALRHAAAEHGRLGDTRPAAHRTERIGLGPGVLVPSLRHPMVNAAATANLAALAPGRVAVAFGTGFTGRRAMGYRAIPWA